MLIHPHDRWDDEAGWRAFLVAQGFGHLVAAGRGRDVPVVVPTQFVVDGDRVLVHLARQNPVWAAIEENDRVVLGVAGDWAYIPSSWKAVGAEDPRRGIPTTLYAAVQVVGRATVLDAPDEVADVLRRQLAALQPDEETVDPLEHGARLQAIRGLSIPMEEVHAKAKFAGNLDGEHRESIAVRLTGRGGPGDVAAAARIDRPTGAGRDA